MIDLNVLKIKNKKESLEYIYKEIDSFILEAGTPYERKYKVIDQLIIDFINKESFSFENYVGLLTATDRFKHKLRNRTILWKKTIEKADVDNKLIDDQIKMTLNNLE
jgi:hypothetical protein